jgi:cell division FtsZ-interacting protein ZapD
VNTLRPLTRRQAEPSSKRDRALPPRGVENRRVSIMREWLAVGAGCRSKLDARWHHTSQRQSAMSITTMLWSLNCLTSSVSMTW